MSSKRDPLFMAVSQRVKIAKKTHKIASIVESSKGDDEVSIGAPLVTKVALDDELEEEEQVDFEDGEKVSENGEGDSGGDREDDDHEEQQKEGGDNDEKDEDQDDPYKDVNVLFFSKKSLF